MTNKKSFMKRSFLLTIIGLMVFGCTEDGNKSEIVGEWKLIEVYNGYTQGGNSSWTTVPSKYSEIIRFTSKELYFENIDSKYLQRECTGTYRLLSDNLLEIESNCQTGLVQHEIELRQETLIIDIQEIEGIIRKKYTSTHKIPFN